MILRALTVLVEVEEKRRFGAPRKNRRLNAEAPDDLVDNATNDLVEHTTSPRLPVAQVQHSEPAHAAPEGNGPKAHSRYIPTSVRREIYERDGHRCTFQSSDGKRCSETRFLEFDHVITPWACGGASTADNLTLRCGAHNRWAANQLFGHDHVESKIRESEQVAGELCIQQYEHQQSGAHAVAHTKGDVR